MIKSAVLMLLPILALAPSASAVAKAHWSLTSTDEGPFLTVGEPDGESPVTSLRCKPRSGRIEITLFPEHQVPAQLKGETWVDKSGKPAPWTTTVHVASGAVSADAPGKTNRDEMNGGSEVELTLPASSPVIQAFAKTGAIKFTSYGESPHDPPVTPAMAAKLVKACSK